MTGEPKNEAPFTKKVAPASPAKKPVAKKKPAVAPRRFTNISEAGLEFIARHEGCPMNGQFCRIYNDAANNATIGVGHLIHMGPYTTADRRKYQSFTYSDAIQLLKQDVAKYVAAVTALNLDLSQNEGDALVSFAFNLGPGALQGGILENLRAGNKPAAMSVLKEYDHAGGQVLAGLVTRRNDEARLFLAGAYK